MPKQTRIQSPTWRKTTIALAMFILLAASLGLARLISGDNLIVVDDLQLAIPGRWRIEQTAQPPDLFEKLTRLTNNKNRSQVLMIAAIKNPEFTDLREALFTSAESFLDAGTGKLHPGRPPKKFRAGDLTGLRFSFIGQQPGGFEAAKAYMIAVVTDRSDRFWTIFYREDAIFDDVTSSSLSLNEELFDQVCASLRLIGNQNPKGKPS